MDGIVQSVALSGGTAVVDFSVWGLFLRSGMVIKVVMLVLFVASFWSWTIIIDKFLRFRRLWAQAGEFEENFWSGGALDELHERVGDEPPDPMSAVFSAAMGEWQRSAGKIAKMTDGARANLQDRIERVMEVTLGREVERIERHMVFLASAGATTPFIGLFGTVWGIMASFQAIAVANSTNIAVVAPGLAEALFTTAMGLVVAIPSIVAYNRLSNDVQRYSHRLESFAAEFSAILSRRLQDGS